MIWLALVLCSGNDRPVEAAEVAVAPPPYHDRWLYPAVNLQVDRAVGELTALFIVASIAPSGEVTSPKESRHTEKGLRPRALPRRPRP